VGVAEEDVHIHMGADDEVSDALNKVDRAAEEADHALAGLGRTGQRAGTEMAAGMNKSQRSTNQARNAAGRFVPAANAAGSAAAGAGAKAGAGASGFDKWGKAADRASRKVGGLSAMTMLIKWGSLITGGVAVIGMLTALAAGAVMAVGALAPMVGVVGALGPAMALMAASTALMKISGEDVKALLRPLGNEFKAMRYEITQALVPGIQQFNAEIKSGLIPTLKTGLVGFAGTVGDAAVKFGAMVSTTRSARMIGVLFNGLRPIVLLLAGALARIVNIFINLAVAALPMTTSMAEGLDRVTTKLEAWSQRMVDSGKAQAWMMRSWDLMKSAGRTLRDFLIGLYNIFRLAGQVARDEFGGGMSDAAAKFRAWTTSAKGSQEILQFFHDSVPALRETNLLIGAILRGLGGLANNPALAPLIAQIRTELLPALGEAIHSFSGTGGFGPAIVDAFTALFTVIAGIPMGGLTAVIQGLAGLIWGVAWLIDHVPGLGTALGMLLGFWTVAGAAFKVAGVGLKAFGWVTGAIEGTGKLSLAQKTLGWALNGVGPLLTSVGAGLRIFGLAMWAALGPVGLIMLAILALGALFVWAYLKFDWFRNGVWTVINAVLGAFVWLAKAAAAPFIELWNIIKGAYNLIAKGWNLIPSIHVPDWVPFVGGKDFSLPKMPMLAEGGMIEYGMAIVGEQGPEALVKGGKLLGMVGMGGPELRTDLPRGGYVVPNPGTLARMGSVDLPSSVLDAVSSALPGYGAVLGRNAAPSAPGVHVDVDTGSGEVVDAIRELAAVMASRSTGSPQSVDTAAIVRELRKGDTRSAIAARYTYQTGRR
jgi:hypothetical protein